MREFKGTPETDAQVANVYDHAKHQVKIDFARKLEIQRNELREALEQINIACCYASEESPEARGETLLHIGTIARAAIAKATIK